MPRALASLYARALADVAGRTGEYRPLLQDLQEFLDVYRESAELREVLETPAVALPEKLKVLDAIFQRLHTSEVASNFLRVLVGNYRAGLLEEVLGAFQDIANDRLGVVRVHVYSASELSRGEREALRVRFEEITRKHVELEFQLASELLAGVRAQIKSTVYDGSVRGHLERIRDRLLDR